ncbi:hypothetical protein AB0H76_37085 [Nocardia sp. NPDC050712]|uniref:hypothetical protein n=1 Tax=Nocardia sp. NPDC050712 TaxID=3155518 RepID=UPI0033D2AAA4
MNPQLDPAIQELLRGSALAPLIDRPVNQILQDMGLPLPPDLSALPPMPGMPPMPLIDLSALLRPFTDLASSFGTGDLGAGAMSVAAGGGLDPTKALGDVNSALQQAMQMAPQALQTVMSLWQSAASMLAAQKQGQAQQDAGELAAQNTQEKGVLLGGATSVATGGALLAACITRYMATVAATAPALAAPGGQAFLAAATAEAIAEATAIVAKTRGELTGHSANMTQAGQKVDVTSAPKSTDQMQQMMQLLQPLMQLAQTGIQSASQLAEQTQSLSAKPLHDVAGKAPDGTDLPKSAEPGAGVGAGGGGGFGGGFGGGGISPAAAPLNAWSGTKVAALGPVSPGVPTGSSSAATEYEATSRGAVSSGGPGMMPMGAGGAMGGTPMRGAGDGGDMPAMLVNAEHTDEVVGAIEGVSLPVVGATENASEPPPDKALTL